MIKTVFIACGFKVEGQSITFASPSTALAHLTSSLRKGDGPNTVAALTDTGHATDGQGFDVYFDRAFRRVDWHMLGNGWSQHVIIHEPLTTTLLAELSSL